MDKILDHRTKDDNGTEYLVKWKNKPEEFNEWVEELDFDNPEILRQYHKTRRAATNIKLKRNKQGKWSLKKNKRP